MRDDSLELRVLRGREVEPWIENVGRLRIEVFREFPYLYEGDADYEARYLRSYLDAASSVAVLVFDGDRVVGASTAIGLAEAEDEFRRPVERAGFVPREVLYFGESVLLPAYRERGVGHRFFDLREREARGRPRVRSACFAAVVRSPDDPRRPPGYRSLEPFWRRRGYERLEGVTTTYAWREVGAAEETEQTMEFWWRRLEPGARDDPASGTTAHERQ